jgi:hypothetical protein
MKNINLNDLPNFDQLPIQNGAPPESSWGVFGENYALGCLNFLTPSGVVEAARLVQSGKVFRLDARIGFAKPPLFGRASVAHKVIPLGPFAHDDMLDHFNTQEGSQWDGLAHVGHARHRAFYNGVTVDQIRDGRNARLGTHHWADRFVGRGVLIDACAFRKAQGHPVNPFERDGYSLAELQGALQAQGTTLKPGTILLVRTGWMEAYEQCTAEERAEPGVGRVALGQPRCRDRNGLSRCGTTPHGIRKRGVTALPGFAAAGATARRIICAGTAGGRLRTRSPV